MQEQTKTEMILSITYVFEGLSAFRSKGCIVGVVVEGVEGVCWVQHCSMLQSAQKPTILTETAETAVVTSLVKRIPIYIRNDTTSSTVGARIRSGSCRGSKCMVEIPT
jgi:hypothetical protein